MSEYIPDSWVVIKLPERIAKGAFKVLGGWSGGFTTGDSWRVNSGIEKVSHEGDYWIFEGYSGSVYRCHKGACRVTMAMAQPLDTFMANDAEVLDDRDNWLSLNKEIIK
jgi:hypothetical protein